MSKINYTEAIELGFKRNDSVDDTVWEKIHGYKYFIVSMRFSKSIQLDWDIETHEVGMFKNHMFVKTLSKEQLLEMLSTKP